MGSVFWDLTQVISCSQFEAHAGRGSRRAPYDNIFTSAGITLKAVAAMLPDLEEETFPAGSEYDLNHIADGWVAVHIVFLRFQNRNELKHVCYLAAAGYVGGMLCCVCGMHLIHYCGAGGEPLLLGGL
jgi:hypothetical protein